MRETTGWIGTLILTVAAIGLLDGCDAGTSTTTTTTTTQRAGALQSVAASPTKGSGLVWHMPNGEIHIWDMASGSDAKEVSLQHGFNADPTFWKIVATGDFNGDGAGDLLLSDASAGLLTEYQLNDTSVATSTFTTHNSPVSTTTVYGTSSASPATAYAADVDGDGVTDIIWRELSQTLTIGSHGASQFTTDNIRSEEWMLTSGQTVPKYDAYMDSPTMSVVGAGDFDASGYADYVFHDSSSGDTQMVFSPGYWWDYGEVPVEWSIMGTGDFNNDGADDLLWYNTSSGDVVIWYMTPGTGDILGGYWIDNVPADSGWRIDGVGDTNHDGVSDIIWEHTSGVIGIWTMSPDAYVADYGALLTKPAGATFAGVIALGPPPAAWSLQFVHEQTNGTEVDALIKFQGKADRPDDYVEIWSYVGGMTKVETVPTFQLSGDTLGAWVNTAMLPGGANGCFMIRPWQQGRTSASFSNSICLNGFPSALAEGHIDFVNQVDNNRCVPDPVHILNRLNTNGELMAWNYSSAGYSSLDRQVYHTETIVRMPYLPGTPLDGSIFASDFSHDYCPSSGTAPDQGSCGAHLGVAKLAFTGGRAGKMLGTNRGFYGSGLDMWDWATTPNSGDSTQPGDTFMPLGSPNPTPHFNMDPEDQRTNHPGGASALGQYLVTGLQGYQTGCTGFYNLYSCNPPDSQGVVQIWNMADPLNPQRRSEFSTYYDNAAVYSSGQGKDAVSVAMTKLYNGGYLMAMITDSPTQRMEFYYTLPGAKLDDSNVFGHYSRAPDAIWPVATPTSIDDMRTHVPEWQSFNILTGCDGSLWAIGSRDEDNSQRYPGPDSIDLYRIVLSGPNGVSMVLASDVAGDAVSSLSMNCSDNSGTQQCSLAAGGGAYVDPDGKVIYYGTDYDNDGNNTGYVHGNGVSGTNSGRYASTGGYIRGKEFHERHGNSAANTACPTGDTAWVEFYSTTNFNRGANWGKIFYQDYATRSLRNPDFLTNGFAGSAQSVRWCMPPGMYYELDSGFGSSGFLKGTGTVMEIADFSNMTYPNGGGGVMENVRSGHFIDSGATPVGWWPGTSDTSN